eukprot:s10442_g2.t1
MQNVTEAVNDELVKSLDYKLGSSNVNYIQSRKDVQYFPSSLRMDFIDPESVKIAFRVTLDSALYESYQKILLSGRSLVFAYPTMHTQVSSIPAGSTSYNATVARAFTKLLGAFVTFRDADDLLGECSNFEHPGDGSQFSANSLESQMQLGALQYPRYPMASDVEHFHFLEILAGTYDSSINRRQSVEQHAVHLRFPRGACAQAPLERHLNSLRRPREVLIQEYAGGPGPAHLHPPAFGISAGQLATVLTAYTPQTEHTANTAAIGVNAAAIAALQGQVAALPAAPDLTPYALAADLAAAEGSILANASGIGGGQWQEHTRFGRPQARQPSHDGGDEQQHRLHKQRHPGDCCGNLRPEIGRGPALFGRRRQARQTAGDVSQFVATALLLARAILRAWTPASTARRRPQGRTRSGQGREASCGRSTFGAFRSGPEGGGETVECDRLRRLPMASTSDLNAAASTLNATTVDVVQLLVGSIAATGTFNSNSSVTANLEVVSNLRVEAPLVRCDLAASVLTTPKGQQRGSGG